MKQIDKQLARNIRRYQREAKRTGTMFDPVAYRRGWYAVGRSKKR